MAGRGRRKKNNNRAGKLCIGMIVIAFVAVMSVQIIRVYQKYVEDTAKSKLGLAYDNEIIFKEAK